MKRLTLSIMIAAACLSAAPVLAQNVANGKNAGKIGHQLMGLYEQSSVRQAVQSATVTPQITMALPEVNNSMVIIDAVAKGDANELLQSLQAMGLQDGSAFGQVVSGRMPVSKLGDMNSMANLRTAMPSMSKANTGSVTTRGDISQGSDVARALYNLDGNGITVGTLSDGYDCLGGAAADVASDDLPANVNVLADLPPGTCSDEGRAMMQFIHDIAPASEQAFHTAFTGVAGFANGIIRLQEEAGADVIVDDIIYFSEPMFQDGVIAQAAQQVADNGSAYFSSAGNGSFNSWEGAFEGSGLVAPFGGELHDFDQGPGVDIFQEFVLSSGSTTFSFQWDQPYFSATGGAGTQSDLDVYIFINGTFIGLGGFNINTGEFGSGDPLELFGINNSGGSVVVQIAIGLFEGPEPGLMKYVHFGSDQRGGGGAAEYATRSGTSYGHSNAANMAGVGAAAWFNTAAFSGFCQPACVNNFSALGGVPIFYDQNDNRILEVRNRPNFVGPDGANTTFFGRDLSFPIDGTSEPDGFPNFFGTSASAPHAAAAAALIKQTNPSLSPAEIYALLEDTATDMVLDEAAGPGFDFRTGTGFINVEAAVEAAATDPENAKKRFVCHGDKSTLSISSNAVAAHMRHGDKFGPCE